MKGKDSVYRPLVTVAVVVDIARRSFGLRAELNRVVRRGRRRGSRLGLMLGLILERAGPRWRVRGSDRNY